VSEVAVLAPPERVADAASATGVARTRLVPLVMFGLTALASVSGIVTALALPAAHAGDGGDRATVVTFLGGMLLLGVVGALVVLRRPEQARIGRLLITVAVSTAVGRALIGLALISPADTPEALAWATNWAWVPGAAAVLVLLLRFPSGALPSPGWRRLEQAVLVWGAAAVGVTALVPGELAVTPLDRDNPYGLTAAGWLEPLLGPVFAVLPLLTLAAASALVLRYRRAGGVERQQLRWVAAAVALLAVAAPLATAGPGWAALLEGTAYLLLPAAVVVAVLRYRLWDLGLVVRRSAVYAVASGVLLLGYVATVAASSQVLDGRAPDAVATALVAVAAVPVLTAVQRAVERLLFGDRRDPDRVVATLAERLAHTPEALLPHVVEAVARSLRLPYVAVELADGAVTAAAGAPGVEGARVALRHRGTTVGWLVAGRRSPGEPLGGRDVRLLERVANQAGLAVHSTLLTTELQHAADRLRAARAEERARLRGDLHDELGPALGAITMRAEAARNLLSAGEPARADRVLADIERGAESAVVEVRRILADLHPRVLEEEGLRAAIRSVTAVVPDGLDVRLDLLLPSVVPPRVELATYRVAAEAVRNVVRHAAASTVEISVRPEAGALLLTVTDDGAGLPPDHRPGVGLRSMHDRAAELGGTLTVATGDQGGTTLRLCLPMRTA
jgi:signal transduction histidine kinase